MDPFTNGCSFQQFLHSQQPNQSFSFATRDPSIEITSSNASVFGTPCSEDAEEVEKTVSDRSARKKWSPHEDLVLISAWLNTSKDPVVGNEQKAIAFWKRIAAYVASSPKLQGLQKRGASNCKQRWGKINDGVCKFVGCYESATKLKSSGQSENDVLKMAYDLFFQDKGVKFTLEHAWLELRYDQKWIMASNTKEKVPVKRRKVDDESGQPPAYVPGEEEARPLGVKAAKAKEKAKGKRKAGSSAETVEFEGMCELRSRDFERKESLSKQKLLDGLITKTEPLTDLEIALKNKLITEMLST